MLQTMERSVHHDSLLTPGESLDLLYLRFKPILYPVIVGLPRFPLPALAKRFAIFKLLNSTRVNARIGLHGIDKVSVKTAELEQSEEPMHDCIQ